MFDIFSCHVGNLLLDLSCLFVVGDVVGVVDHVVPDCLNVMKKHVIILTGDTCCAHGQLSLRQLVLFATALVCKDVEVVKVHYQLIEKITHRIQVKNS